MHNMTWKLPLIFVLSSAWSSVAYSEMILMAEILLACRLLEPLHDVCVSCVLEQHVLLLLDRLNLLPVPVGDVLLDQLVVVQEEVVETGVAVGNVPGQDAT